MNYFLDTSIFFEMIKTDEKVFAAKLSKNAPGKKFASHYSAIEFNRGLVQTLVEFYVMIEETRDVPSAIVNMTNKYTRAPKYTGITLAYILRMAGLVNGDYRIFLSQLEAAITDICDRANNLVKDFIGYFRGHELGHIGIDSGSDFAIFIRECSIHSSVDLTEFWQNHLENLEYIFSELIDRPRLLVDEAELLAFVYNILSDGNLKYKRKDDFVISLEAPKSQTMVSKDASFSLFMPLMNKKLNVYS